MHESIFPNQQVNVWFFHTAYYIKNVAWKTSVQCLFSLSWEHFFQSLSTINLSVISAAWTLQVQYCSFSFSFSIFHLCNTLNINFHRFLFWNTVEAPVATRQNFLPGKSTKNWTHPCRVHCTKSRRVKTPPSINSLSRGLLLRNQVVKDFS